MNNIKSTYSRPVLEEKVNLFKAPEVCNRLKKHGRR